MTIDATTGGQTQKQKIDQKIDVKVTPAGEKPADEVKAADEAKSDAKSTDTTDEAEKK